MALLNILLLKNISSRYAGIVRPKRNKKKYKGCKNRTSCYVLASVLFCANLEFWGGHCWSNRVRMIWGMLWCWSRVYVCWATGVEGFGLVG